MPEKLPCDQLCRDTISESAAKLSKKSVAAEQIYPIMMPATRRAAIWRTRLETASKKPSETSEPRKAASTSASELVARFRAKKSIMQSATASRAPEETPSTQGPAIGFAK